MLLEAPRKERLISPYTDDDARPVGWPSFIVARMRRDVTLALLDLAIVFGAYLAPLVLRFNGAVPLGYWGNFRWFVLVAGFVHLSTNYLFGLYGQMWRYASVQEARRVVLAAFFGGAIILATSLFLSSHRLMPVSVVIIGATLSLMGFGAVRFQSRLFGFRRRSIDDVEPIRVLLVGAGEAGSMVLKDLARNPSLGMTAVGIVDDDPRKVGLSLNGVPVLGRRSAIPALARRLRIDQVLLTVPSATSELIRDVAAMCEKADVTLRVLPSIRETVGGRVTARDIRDLKIEDLLGRQQVKTDLEAVASIIRERRILVSGAGGSIGAEIVRQIVRFDPSSILLLDHDETHLHDLLTEVDGHKGVETALADIRDQDRVLSLFMRFRPEVVFHAAAHKHVDMLEGHPEEALRTNIMGTANLTDAAVATGVERFVLISTDKAVRPASVMGASKWFGEQIVRSVPNGHCVFCAVRFGNVLGSRGSVIPTFLRQISMGGPVTVTDPSMRRYFMSVEEAVQLVLQAAALSTGGEVFTLDMGEPVNILDLAKRLIRISGRVPDRDVHIEIVGVRPGEKLVEDIVDPVEESVPSGHSGIIVSRPTRPDRPALRRAIREMESLAAEGRVGELANRMKTLAGQPLRSVPAEVA
jgi:FlaA1/EpsC-like NDP-sugar epimerase